MIRKLFLVIIIAIGIGYSNICIAQNIKPYFRGSKKLEHPYGLCSHFEYKGNQWKDSVLPEQTKLMCDAGCNMVRLGLFRKEIYEKETGVFDKTFSILNKANIDILPIAYDFRLTDNEWLKENIDFDNLVKTFRQNYAHWLNYIELHNEVNFSKLKGLGRHYTDDLKLLYCLKKRNRKIKILFSGLADSHWDFLDSVMQQKAYKYFDIMNFHTYHLPEDIHVPMKIIRDNMDKYHWEKPVWLTECGMTTSIPKGGSVADRISKEEEQARRIARIYLIAFAYGVDKVFIYELPSPEKNPYDGEEHFGIVHKDNSPKPAYIAYKTLTRMLPSGSTRPTLSIQDGVYRAEWKRPDGKNVMAMWCRKENTTEVIDTNKYEIVDYMGNRVMVNDSKMKVSSGIVYMISK